MSYIKYEASNRSAEEAGDTIEVLEDIIKWLLLKRAQLQYKINEKEREYSSIPRKDSEESADREAFVWELRIEFEEVCEIDEIVKPLKKRIEKYKSNIDVYYNEAERIREEITKI